MATKSPLSSAPTLSDATPEEADLSQKYLAQQKELLELLDSRKNRMFDPTLLALARGFASPTKTGSFFEAAGNAAGLAAETMDKEDKAMQENALMRMQLAQSGLETARKGRAEKMMGQYLSTGEPTEGAPAEAGEAGAQPKGLRAISSKDVAAMSLVNPEYGKILGDMYKAQSERYKIAMNGTVFDTETGKYLDMAIPGQTPAKFTIPEVRGEVSMLPSQHSAYLRAREAGLGREWIRDFMSAEGGTKNYDTALAAKKAPSAGGAPKVETPDTSVSAPITTAEIAAQEARAKSEAEEAGKGAGKRTSAAMDATSQAQESKNAAMGLKELASQEGADQVWGIFEKPTIKSAIAGMVENGRFVPEDIRSAAIKTGIAVNVPKKPDETAQQYTERKQAILDRYYQGVSLAAQLQFQASMLAKGQGAISNGERQLFADTTISRKDTVQTLQKKADMIIARADFTKSLADKLSDSGMSIDRYKQTPEYKASLNAYETKLRNIWNPRPTGKGGSSTEDARARLNSILEGKQ